MKTFYFVRHAKSSWDDMSLSDKDRPLNKRGLRDAPFMAQVLKGKGVRPDAIISSPANRALSTAQFFAKELEVPKDKVIIEDTIYEAYIDEVLQILHSLNPEWKTVLIFGHNPTFTSLANLFTEEYIPNVPTCGITKIESSTSKWAKIDKSNSILTEFIYPKQYF